MVKFMKGSDQSKKDQSVKYVMFGFTKVAVILGVIRRGGIGLYWAFILASATPQTTAFATIQRYRSPVSKSTVSKSHYSTSKLKL